MRGTGRSTLIQGFLLAAIVGTLAIAAALTSGPTAALWCLGAGAAAVAGAAYELAGKGSRQATCPGAGSVRRLHVTLRMAGQGERAALAIRLS